MGIKTELKHKALKLGFDFAGFAPARKAPHAREFNAWLEQGCHADMRWMERNIEQRLDPRNYFKQASTILTVGLSYFTEPLPPALRDDPRRGWVAAYAWGPDYHDKMASMLKTLADEVDKTVNPVASSRWALDTAPLLEREVAAATKIGFIGRNTQFIHPGWGSCVWLAEILIARDLEPDPVIAAHPHAGCGDCRLCLEGCPTGALDAPYHLDARRCISYLTMEHRGSIEPQLRPRMKRWIFGCDDCQILCPWTQKHARRGKNRFLKLDPRLAAPLLEDLLAFDKDAFKARYKGTPLFRAGINRLRRNACIAMGNSGIRDFIPALHKALSDNDHAVREHAAWAIERLCH